MHELVETWLPEAYFLKFPDWQSNVHFPWPSELTICWDIDGFQIPVKTLCTGHRRRKPKENLLSGKSAWYCFMVNAQTPITASLSTYLLYGFTVNVMCRMIWSYRKPYNFLSFNFVKQYSAYKTCTFNFGEYAGICHLPLTSLKELNFPWLILNFPVLLNCPLRGKELIFLAR